MDGRFAPALRAALAACTSLLCIGAGANEPITIALNWTPNAHHAPLYFARAQGWYAAQGIDLVIEPLLGSASALERLRKRHAALALADFVAWLRAAADGADGAAVLALEDASPYALYFDRTHGLTQAAQLSGRRIASQPRDPMRALWPALAARHGFDTAPRWFDLTNRDKPAALARGEIDGALNPFLHNHLAYVAALGERLGVLWWRDLGFDAYGLVLVAGAPLMEHSPDLLRRFVAVTQAAWAQCRVSPDPCLLALLAAQADLDPVHERALWHLAQRGPASGADPGGVDPRRVDSRGVDPRGVDLGGVDQAGFDAGRVRRSWAALEAAVGVQAPSTPVTSDRFLPTTTTGDPR